MQHLAELGRTLVAALTAASVVSYGCGYLALRSRAYALGTDPTFQLLDQIYVFAGARFFISTLVIGLVLAPAIILVHWLALRLAQVLTGPTGTILRWISVIALAATAFASLAFLVSANGILLRDHADLTLLDRAVLGLSGGKSLRAALFLVPTLSACLALLWLTTLLRSGVRTVGIVLAAVTALQLFMLPVLHGVLFADRRVRVLARSPDMVSNFVPPIGIVDRTAEQAVLFGRDATGRPLLTTVAVAELYGLPVETVVALGSLVAPDASQFRPVASRGPERWVRVADASSAVSDLELSDGAGSEEDFFETVFGYLGMVLDSVGSLGGGPDAPGALWTIDFDAAGQPGEPRRVGTLADVTWPVVAPDGGFVVLQDNRVVQLDEQGGVVRAIAEGSNLRKLIGVTPDGAVMGLLRRPEGTVIALIKPDGSIILGPTTSSNAHLSRLTQDARAYDGGLVMVVERSSRGGRGFDVFLRTPRGTLQLSDCGDDHCGQPSLSADRQRAVFIRSPGR